MVFVLHRYIFRELMKVFVPATVALTLILNLGMILRPVQDYGVGPNQVLHLLGYFLPITLTFVLPVAALFAAALVYGRFASDNELDACKASGISLMTLVYPGLMLAIAVAIINLVLSFHVVPEFFHRAESAIKADAKQILFRNIQRRGYYVLPSSDGYRIYADEANPARDMLGGVIVTKFAGGGIERSITTEKARINFIERESERFSEVHIAAQEVYLMERDNETWAYMGWFPFQAEVPSLLGDDIKFKKIDEMQQIRSNPLAFYPIEEKAHAVVAQFTMELLAQQINDGLARDPNYHHELNGESNIIRFKAVSCEIEEEKIRLTDVNVYEVDVDTGEIQCSYTCSEATLKIEGEKLDPTLMLEMQSPQWKKADGEGYVAGPKRIPGLLLPGTIEERIGSDDVLGGITPANISLALNGKASDKLDGLLAVLKKEINDTLVEITAEMHTRLVFGIGCVPLIVIGIGLGVIYRGGHLLAAFGASVVPLGLLIICILMGKNLTKNPSGGIGSGLMLMWAGLAVLTVLAVILHRKLIRN